MSLREFQRALGDFVASPELCRAAIADPRWVRGEYELTDRELKRLLHSAEQPGMQVCWSLHRANRFGPIHAVLPLTCRALGSLLRRELDAFWGGALPQDLQFKSEAQRFASFLRRRVRDGHLPIPVVDDLVSFELALADLRFLPQRNVRETLRRAEAAPGETRLILHPLVRLLRFRHDPERLLAALINEKPLPPDLRPGNHYLLIDGNDGAMAIRLLDERLGGILSTFDLGIPQSLSEVDLEALRKAGLIARWPKDEAPACLADGQNRWATAPPPAP